MRVEKSQRSRRHFNYPARIDVGDGSPVRSCAVVDVSQTGARLAVEEAETLPQEFALLLSSDGGTRRWCYVVWRSDLQIGVEFLVGPPKRRAPPQGTEFDAPAVQETDA